MEIQPLKPLLTPGQKTLLKYGKIPDLISRFDLHPFSSPEAKINAMISYKIMVQIATLSGTPKPPNPDFSQYAPISDDGATRYAAFIRQIKIDKLPPGYCLDNTDKVIFDRNFSCHPKDLPHDHPDYVPF